MTMELYSNQTRGYNIKRRLNVGTDANPIWIDNVHEGRDFALTLNNDDVRAVQPGEVIFSGRVNKYGHHLRVRRDAALVIGYHSLGAASPLRAGSEIEIGDWVGLTGESASGANGNHVHVQAWLYGVVVDPLPYIRGGMVSAISSTPIESEIDDMYSQSDRERDELVALRVEKRNLPVLVKTAASKKVWLSDLVHRRLVNDGIELGRIQNSLYSRLIPNGVNEVPDLNAFGVPALTPEQAASLTFDEIHGKA